MGNVTKTLRALTVLLSAALLSSCLRDDIREIPVLKSGSGNNPLVTLSVRVPGSGGPATRALDGTNEEEIDEIRVLAFTAGSGSDGTEDTKLRYVGKSIGEPVKDEGRTKEFVVELYTGEWDLMVLANCEGLVNTIGTAIGQAVTWETLAGFDLTKSQIRDALSKSASDKWSVETGNKNYLLPMWGMKAKVDVQPETTQIIQTVNLYRMLSKVSVRIARPGDEHDGVTYDGVQPATFRLGHVSLHNYNTTGRVIPGLTSDYGLWASDGGKALKPSLPAVSGFKQGYTKSGDVITCDQGWGAGDLTEVDNALEGVIYTFEASAGTGSETRPCVIIGGYYDGSEELSYYRADFVDESKNHLALLRNHHYNMLVTKVSGKGYDTIEDAYLAGPTNMEVEVIEWNEGGLDNIVWNGQNFLGVSPSDFNLYRDAKTGNRFTITTDYSGGWTITGATKEPDGGDPATWIENISPMAGSGDKTKQTVTFDVQENNEGHLRKAYIQIRAGILSYAVTVHQGTSPDIGIWITDANGNEIPELIFTSAAGVQPEALNFFVRWAPPSSSVHITSSAVSGVTSFSYDAAYDRPGESMNLIVDGSGERMLNIRPTIIESDPFLERASKVDFTVSSGVGYASKSFYLRQVNFNTIADVASSYMLNGNSYSFTVRSNTQWVIKPGSLNDEGILDIENMESFMSQSGGYNTSTTLSAGNTFTFKLKNDEDRELSGKKATLTLIDPTGRMREVEVVILGATCGSGGVAILQHIGDNDYLTHMYGTGDNERCWMVQNSKEGNGSGRAFGRDWNNVQIGSFDTFNTGMSMYDGQENGYYYTLGQATTNNACPPGWRIPKETEVEVLRSELSVNINADKAKWWCGSKGASNYAFAGGLNGTNVWYHWGDCGFWWHEQGTYNFFSGTHGSISRVVPLTWMSVRCVQDQK